MKILIPRGCEICFTPSKGVQTKLVANLKTDGEVFSLPEWVLFYEDGAHAPFTLEWKPEELPSE